MHSWCAVAVTKPSEHGTFSGARRRTGGALLSSRKEVTLNHNLNLRIELSRSTVCCLVELPGEPADTSPKKSGSHFSVWQGRQAFVSSCRRSTPYRATLRAKRISAQ